MSLAIKFVVLLLSFGLLGHAVKNSPSRQAPGEVHAADDGNPFPPKP